MDHLGDDRVAVLIGCINPEVAMSQIDLDGVGAVMTDGIGSGGAADMAELTGCLVERHITVENTIAA